MRTKLRFSSSLSFVALAAFTLTGCMGGAPNGDIQFSTYNDSPYYNNMPSSPGWLQFQAPANAIAGQAFNVRVLGRDSFNNAYAPIIPYTLTITQTSTAQVLVNQTITASGMISFVPVTLSTAGQYNLTISAPGFVSVVNSNFFAAALNGPNFGGWNAPAVATSIPTGVNTYTFDWKPATDSLGPGLRATNTYQVETFANGNCTGTAATTAQQTGTTVPMIGLIGGTTYSVRITAYDSTGVASLPNCSPPVHAVPPPNYFLMIPEIGSDTKYFQFKLANDGSLFTSFGSVGQVATAFTGINPNGGLVNVHDARFGLGKPPVTQIPEYDSNNTFNVWNVDPNTGLLTLGASTGTGGIGYSPPWSSPNGLFNFLPDSFDTALGEVKNNISSGTLLPQINPPGGLNFQPAAVFDTSGSYYYQSTTNGTNLQVVAYALNQSTGALTQVGTTMPTTFTSITNMFTSPSGTVLFATGYSSGSNYVYSFKVNADGSLTAGSSLSLGSGTASQVSYMFDNTGNYVYLQGTANPVTAGFQISLSTGTLTPVAGSPFALQILGQQCTDLGGNFFAYAVSGGGIGLGKFVSGGSLLAITSTYTISVGHPTGCTFSPLGTAFYISEDLGANSPLHVMMYNQVSGVITDPQDWTLGADPVSLTTFSTQP